MERHGFIRDILDVKVLILFVMARIDAPADADTIYALCFQDDCLSYFDVKEALPQLVQSGHLEEHNGRYSITEKGRLHGAATEDSIAYPVLQRAKVAVEAHNLEMHRAGRIRADIIEHGPNEISTVMTLSDGTADLMRLELAVPNRKQAQRLAHVFQTRADAIYAKVLHAVLEELDDHHANL